MGAISIVSHFPNQNKNEQKSLALMSVLKLAFEQAIGDNTNQTF